LDPGLQGGIQAEGDVSFVDLLVVFLDFFAVGPGLEEGNKFRIAVVPSLKDSLGWNLGFRKERTEPP
jgi:hypothetical protein